MTGFAFAYAVVRVCGSQPRKNPGAPEIAVLSKFKSSVKSLQKAFVTRFGESNRVLIDTVERVQGLTCDICIFFIPNDLCYMSLDRALFNVATSRAKMNTIIICDENILTQL